MSAGEDVSESTDPPLPVTRWILLLVNWVATKASLEEYLYRKYNFQPRSSFVEYLVLGRLGLAFALLFAGYLPVYHLETHARCVGILVSVLVQLYAGYLILHTLAAQLRIQLLDRQLGQPATNHTRTLILSFLNLIQVAVLFAAIYQTSFYSYQHRTPDNAALVGSGLQRKEIDGLQVLELRPNDALYFSIVTLATIGYGDVSPNHPVIRWLVIAEILTSLIGLAIVLALSLSLFGPRGEDPKREFYSDSARKREEYLKMLRGAPGTLDIRQRRNYKLQWLVAIGCWSLACASILANCAFAP